MSLGGGKRPNAKTPTKALGIDFQSSQYGQCIIVGFGQNKVAGNCIWYANFKAIAQQQQQSGGKGGGGGGSSGPTSYTYKTDYMLGLTEGPGTIVHVYNGTSTTSLSATGGISFSGTVGQAAWSNLSGNEALGYSGTVLVAYSARDLGSNASLPNDNYEVAWTSTQFGSGILDADPTVVATQICTNAQYGVNFSKLGDLTLWRNYCLAAGIFVSPVYDQQQPASQALADLFKYTNSDCYFSEGVLKVGCYGDATITGNGVTYTPNTSSVADLTPDDFLVASASDDLIQIHRTAPADALNIQRLEFADRSNTYHKSQVVAMIDDDVVTNGGRSDTTETTTMITSAAIARLVAQNMVQRSFYIRNKYEFVLSDRYCYLEPFDIVTLTNADQGFNLFPVRITEVEEDEHDNIKVTAEEFPEGTGHAAQYSTQSNSGGTVDPNSDPGPVAGPYLFRGPGFLVGNGKPEIWCAVTGDGNPLWAGCDVYLSHDGTSYTFCCSYARQSRYGYITNTMAVQADPDTVSTPNVLLNGYQTQLLGGSQADADQFITLCMIDGEVMAYETATLAAGPSYNLSYLRRGGYGTAIAAHSANAPFVRLDDGILRIPVDPSQIGNTIYLKFLSFNCFGRTPRTLSSETAYQYVIGTSVELPDVPVVPDNFAVLPVADGVNITWTNDNPAAVGCTSIEYATASSGPWTVLAQEGPTTTNYTHHFVTGATYYYRARSRGPVVAAGWSAYTATFSSTGVNVSNISNTATAAQNSAPIINPNFGTGDLTGWTSDAGTWAFQQGTAGPETGTSTYAIRTGSSGTPTDTLRNLGNIRVYAGATVKAACSIRANGANGTCACLISWRDATGAEIHVSQGNTVTGTTLAASFVADQAPAGAIMAHIEAAAISHTTGSYAVDGFIAPILPDSLDQVPDSATRFASPLSQAIILAGNTPGGNMVPNPMFALGFLDWTHGSGWGATSFQGETIAAIGLNGTATTSILTSAAMPVAGSVAISAGLDVFAGVTFTAGDVSADFQFRDSSGTSLGFSSRIFNINSNMSGFARQSLANIVTPANTASMTMRIYIENASGSGSIFVKRIKVEKGTVCTPWNDDATQFGNQLTNPGSGQQLGDQRNTPSSLSRGYGAVRSATALTAHSTGAIDVNAHSITMGSAVISYSAHANAITGCAVGSTQYVYTRDNYAGGSPTWAATTSAATANSFDDAYIAGNVTIPSSGSSGGGGAGGGTGSGCVGVNMFLRHGLRAKDLRWWQWLDCARGGRLFRRFQSWFPSIRFQPCVHIVAEGGAELECSISTPFDLRDGSMLFARDMYGHEVLTDHGWRKVVDVIGIGIQPVRRIHVWGNHFAAGADPGNRIYSHNPVK